MMSATVFCKHFCVERSSLCADFLKSSMLFTRTFHLKKIRRMEDPEYLKTKPVFKHAPNKLKSRKRIYTWGNATTGALGNLNFLFPLDGKKPIDEFKRPHRMSYVNDMQVYDAAAGYGFTVFAGNAHDTDHKLFGTGLNTDSQIGNHRGEGDVPMQVLVKPVPIPLPARKDAKVLKVSCGRSHTACLTSDGEVFTLGNNAFGQCGRPIVQNEVYLGRYNVNKIDGIGDDVADVICGQDHTFFLCKNGAVYACGWGADGQTGLGTYDSVWKPSKLGGDIKGENIVHLSSTGDSVLACNDKGDLFGWGNSEYAQFSSITEDKQLNVPRKLPYKGLGKIIKVAAGGTMCAVLNDQNQLHVWGFGLLGKGPKLDHSKEPSLIPQTLFGCDEFNPDVKLISVHAGLSNFAAITSKGDLYMWGKNRNGNLGTNEGVDLMFPWRVPVPAFVIKVALGIDHTVALCTTFM